MKKLKKVWKSKTKILEGIWYNHIVFFFNRKHWALKLVNQRREICAACPLLDKNGSGENVVIQGFPSCGVCGCNIKELTACLSCDCSDEKPRWSAVSVKDDYKLEDFVISKDRSNGEVL